MKQGLEPFTASPRKTPKSVKKLVLVKRKREAFKSGIEGTTVLEKNIYFYFSTLSGNLGTNKLCRLLGHKTKVYHQN